jgi:hypothetical protein
VALVLLGDRHDETEVRVDHQVLRLLVPALDPLRELDLLLRRQQRVAAGFVEEELERVCRRDGEVAVDIDGVVGFGTRAVVGELDAALLEVRLERLDFLVCEVVLLRELGDRGEVQAALLLASRDQRLDLVGAHTSASFPPCSRA